MFAALLLLQAAPTTASQTAVDAERAFYRAAQTKGQWTAFREFAAPDATVFTPQPARAHEVLPAKNPAVAVQWWPAESYVSCDGKVAVNTGPWLRPESVGYFTTVWERQPDGGWKWIMDGGDGLEKPRALPEKPQVRRALCRTTNKGLILRKRFVGVQTDPPDPGLKTGGGSSPDGTLEWYWVVSSDGSREFRAEIWNGRKYEAVIFNKIAAPKP
jgi:hypothetical protein